MLTIEINGIIVNKLHFIKAVKSGTGWGLKEAKDWVDGFELSPIQKIEVKSEIDFIDEVDKVITNPPNTLKYSFPRRERDLKLLKIGIGDRSSKIDSLSRELSIISVDVGGYNQSRIKHIFESVLRDIDDESINKIITNLDSYA